MKPFYATGIFLLLLTSVCSAQNVPQDASEDALVKITRSGSQPPEIGIPDYYTGIVRKEALFDAEDPSRVAGGVVTYEPGARTAWHVHPLGQVLIISSGTGLVQQWGQPVQEVSEGDIIWIPAGVKHWHGATDGSRMRHVVITESLDGKSVEWLEKVEQHDG
ncbi:(R)-mandelonitrile lyase [Rhizobium sp. GN54]|uniref:(R)-mandelonitrile lyase n=1 Tax=Rhizobium sp. GN54 TaxID=2898150 RepID=UPI001E62F72C|nr:cupin domain-containing protein [Rhizobium sp. GN54]MCD2185385.1 cupin domain-containing protein [Rhizobium sp. GN54]